MADAVLHVKNWREFQHYNNRRPPWIKLHVALLENFEFQSLPLASRALAPMLWLLASETTDGTVPADPGLLAFRLRWDSKELADGLTALIQHGFLIDASNALATCSQTPLYSVSKSKNKKEEDASKSLAFDPATVPGLSLKAWELWVEHRAAIKKPLKPHSLPLAAKQLAALGANQLTEVERAVAGGWQGLHPVSHKAAAPTKPADPYRNAL